MLDQLRNSSKLVGIKQSVKAVENDRAKAVYIANDAEERVVARLKDLCQQKSVQVVYVDSMKALGKACGIDVDAAVVCLTK